MRLLAVLCLLALCAMAARASAAPAPALFRLTIVGTSTAEWDHTEHRIGVCSTTVRSQGLRTVRFHSRRATLVRFVGSRIVRVVVRQLAGSAVVSGHQTVTSDCSPSDHTCAKTRITFANGSTTLTAAGAGRVAIATPAAQLARPDCPLQPADVAATPLGPAVGPLRISPASLANPRVATITLTASVTRRKTYGESEKGESAQRSRWTVTLVRTDR